jgi:hypothetical protein
MTSPASTTSPAAEWAHWYAQAGWRSFPVWPGEKRPIYAKWPADATTDADQIERYFRNPDNNVGIVTGEAFEAWDIEVDHVPAFEAWLDREGHVLPEGPLASTGRGGIHFLTAPTVGHTRKLYLDGQHIGELKSTGGFILVCPSVTEQMYRWLYLPRELKVQPAPDWLVALCDAPERPKTAPKMRMWRSVSLAPESDILPLVAAVKNAKQNDRNATLHWAACRAYDDGIAQKIALDGLLPPFMAIALPGESAYERNIEGRATIASAYNHE